MPRPFPYIVCLALASIRGFALTVQAVAVPISVSGTLSPYRVTVDNLTVARGKFALSTLSLNGTLITPKAGKHRPFFQRSDADRIEFLCTPVADRPEEKVTVVLPRIEEIKLAGSELKIRVSKNVKGVRLDSKEVPLKNAMVTWPLPADGTWYAATHVVELEAARGKPGRFYNLSFASGRDLSSRAEVDLAAPERDEASRWRLNLVSFGGLFGFQGVGTSSFGLKVAWNPAWRFSPDWSLRANLGSGILRAETGSPIVTLDYELLLSYLPAKNLAVALGGGAETWVARGGTGPKATVDLGYAFDAPILSRVEQVRLGYSEFFHPVLRTHEIGLEVVIRL